MTVAYEDLPPRRLGESGIEVFPLGMGCWAIGGPDTNLGLPMGWGTADDDASLRGLVRAFELGANLFDTADVYGHGRSERLLGRLLREVPRERVVVTSKVGYFAGTAPNAYSPLHMRHQLEQTLENLGTDYLDVYFLHNFHFGPGDEYLMPAVEQMRRFQTEGLVRAVGMRGPHRFAVERLTVAKGERADKYARFRRVFEVVRPQVLAVRYNALTPDTPQGGEDIFAFAARHGAGRVDQQAIGAGPADRQVRPGLTSGVRPG
ncbi:Aldo/keto reductase [Carbonactinospora thermoautotrophica]|uniref:Aldo/keto reductase n=1 Tax=Carbonactinospora thermoautotrophica TaxID=1469144 RepID=A0A132MWR8_9ACTN|nr:aldo/keto reductase [Carbonactinospora thermoautotrophica]KWX02283.1 Aldo/keto reductase [Carbonactinospora thermoautotrophica]